MSLFLVFTTNNMTSFKAVWWEWHWCCSF